MVRATVLMLVLLFASGYSCTNPDSHHKGPIKVLTTIAPLYCFTANIAGDAADVENLIPSGAGPHEYSLSPGDVKRIAEARVVVKNGVNLETWLDKALDVSGFNTAETGKIVADTSNGIDSINGDPHIWLSPRNAMVQVKNIRDALVRVDPENRTLYERNAASYISELENLDREIRETVAGWGRRDVVTFHAAFKYFFRDYGLLQAAVIQERPEVEPSPKHIAEVIEIIKERRIRALFTEPLITHKIVNSLAADLGLNVYSLDTLESGMPDRKWYIEKMRGNLAMLGKALNSRS